MEGQCPPVPPWLFISLTVSKLLIGEGEFANVKSHPLHDERRHIAICK